MRKHRTLRLFVVMALSVATTLAVSGGHANAFCNNILPPPGGAPTDTCAGPVATVFLSLSGANSYNASSNTSGWPISATFRLEFQAWVDGGPLQVNDARSCNGRELCSTPNHLGIPCGNIASFHMVNGRAYAYNTELSASDSKFIECN